MKQITIYDLLPLLRKGWVAMDSTLKWYYYTEKPTPIKMSDGVWRPMPTTKLIHRLSDVFNIVPFDGDWKDSLMECGK